MEQGEIILYQPNDSLRLEVRLDGDNVWLNRSQLAITFVVIRASSPFHVALSHHNQRITVIDKIDIL